jgi:hypothetical protein
MKHGHFKTLTQPESPPLVQFTGHTPFCPLRGGVAGGISLWLGGYTRDVYERRPLVQLPGPPVHASEEVGGRG